MTVMGDYNRALAITVGIVAACLVLGACLTTFIVVGLIRFYRRTGSKNS